MNKNKMFFCAAILMTAVLSACARVQPWEFDNMDIKESDLAGGNPGLRDDEVMVGSQQEEEVIEGEKDGGRLFQEAKRRREEEEMRRLQQTITEDSIVQSRNLNIPQ